MRIAIALFSTLFIALCTIPATASVHTFVDNNIEWPGWDTSPNRDVNGLPDITGGSVEGIRTLDALSVTYHSDYKLRRSSGRLTSYGKAWKSLSFGDIFINANPQQDDDWDYIIQATANDTLWNIYQGVIPYDSPHYLMSYSDSGRPRQNHPYAIELDSYATTLVGTASFDGWKMPAGNGRGESKQVTSNWVFNLFNDYSWDFTGDSFVLGLTVTCANDVLHEEIPIPAPEPGTWLLFAIGLSMLLCYRRKAPPAKCS